MQASLTCFPGDNKVEEVVVRRRLWVGGHRRGWTKAGAIRQFLDAVKNTLEPLDLRFTVWSWSAMERPSSGSWRVEGSLGSLKDFCYLNYPSLTWPLLLGWNVEGAAKLIDVLPESLENPLTDKRYGVFPELQVG